MPKRRQYSGFSLVEVLLAVATLAIGMMFIGGTFLAGVYLSTVSTERTMATVVVNEAVAKVRLFLYDDGFLDRDDPNLATDRQTPFDLAHYWLTERAFDANEYAYPSTRTLADKQYFWSALCRRKPSDPNHALLVTVFVSRKVGTATRYVGPAGPMSRPVPMPIRVAGTVGSNVLTITDDPRWIGEGYTIVENSTGDIYRVIERGAGGAPADKITLDKPWWPSAGVYPDPTAVWAVPPPSLIPSWVPPALPPVGGGGPCIAVYPTEIRF